MGKASFAYVGVCTTIYVLLAIAETFVFWPLLDLISVSESFHLYAYLFMFIVINPFITRFLGDLVKFKEVSESDD